MSSDEIVISARGLGKSYHIAQRQQHSTMTEALLHRLKNPFARAQSEEMWALHDVSFDIARGDIVGVLGRNGAGKSTLFKVLSRITEPTTGTARLSGRVASLIEVGTGFQPELTGRENIYLNGAILGMRRREITRRFDEIVDFSGVERFLDTPVKHYSSGMYVRLAFAVAAHLDTDILFVDEVLSVGDAEFQKKSLGKMGDVANDGKTVIFVSHNLATLDALCSKGLFLENGRLVAEGPFKKTLEEYQRRLSAAADGAMEAEVDFNGKYRYFRKAGIFDKFGIDARAVTIGDPVEIRFVVDLPENIPQPTFAAVIEGPFGNRVMVLNSPKQNQTYSDLFGPCEIICNIDSLPLAPGDYGIYLVLEWGDELIEHTAIELQLTVQNSETQGNGWGFSGGVCITKSDWSAANLKRAITRDASQELIA